MRQDLFIDEEDDDLDQLFRQATERLQAPYEASAWQAMELKLIQVEKPPKAERKEDLPNYEIESRRGIRVWPSGG